MYYTLDSLKVLEEHNAKKNRKWFKVGQDFMSCVDFTGMDVVVENMQQPKRFVIGDMYSLSGAPCDGFQMRKRTYELVGIVDTFHGVDINSLVVKQVGGDESVKFALSKSDCEDMGVEYQNGLILLPRDLGWEHVVPIKPFNPIDVSSSPLSIEDERIRYVLLEVKGFKDYNKGYVMTPNQMLLKEEDIVNTLRVVAKRPIVYGSSGLKINEGLDLAISIVYPHSNDFIFNNGNFIASNGSMFILINLINYDEAEGGYCGVDPSYIEGLHPCDLFTVMWDEQNAYTLEEIKKKNKEIEQRKLRKEERTEKAIAAMNGQIEGSMSHLMAGINTIRSMSLIPAFFGMDESLQERMRDVQWKLNEVEKDIRSLQNHNYKMIM